MANQILEIRGEESWFSIELETYQGPRIGHQSKRSSGSTRRDLDAKVDLHDEFYLSKCSEEF